MIHNERCDHCTEQTEDEKGYTWYCEVCKTMGQSIATKDYIKVDIPTKIKGGL